MSPNLKWFLVIAGAILILIEIVLGAITGFDFLLIGSAVLLGGVCGLLLHSGPLGLAVAGILSLLYLLVGRRWVRGRLKRPDIPSNVDALIGRSAQVVQEVGPHTAGRVELEGEQWRALLDLAAKRGPGQEEAPPAIAAGSSVRITRVDGVTVDVEAVSAAPGQDRP